MVEPNDKFLDTPELRMIGIVPNQTWQWRFPGEKDNRWRDMMQTVPHRKKQVVANFEVMAMRGNLLPEGFLEKNSTEYGLVLAELWSEVTGFMPHSDTSPARYDKDHTYKADIDAEDEVLRMADIVADRLDWQQTSDKRNYNIDWDSGDPAQEFLIQSNEDYVRGITYDDPEAVLAGTNVLGSYAAEAEAMANFAADDDFLTSADPLLERKVIADFDAKIMADNAAAGIRGSTVEKRDGKWVVTVPPGWGGFDSDTIGKAWVKKAGLDEDEWPVEPNAEGTGWFIRKAPLVEVDGSEDIEEAIAAVLDAGGKPEHYDFIVGDDKRVYPVYKGEPEGIGGRFDSWDEARNWLRNTGNQVRDPNTGNLIHAENVEIVPFEGKWVIREKAAVAGKTTVKEAKDAVRAALGLGEDEELPEYEFPIGPDGLVQTVYVGEPEADPTYSTATTPGDMFMPQVFTDPTGQRTGVTAAGGIQEMGYDLASEMAQADYERAGDIAQTELAGYQVPERSLDMIVAKAIERGNWQLARSVQAFMDRPSERDLLDYAAQYAEAPADLAVLSAIARGEQMVQPAVPFPEGMGRAMGQATRIGPPGEVYSKAYADFLSAMDQGHEPTEEEMRDLFDPTKDPAYIATQNLVTDYEKEMKEMRAAMLKTSQDAASRIEANQTKVMDLISGTFRETLTAKDKSYKDLQDNMNAMLMGANTTIDQLRDDMDASRRQRLETAEDDDGTASTAASTSISGESRGQRLSRLSDEFMKAMGMRGSNPYTKGMTVDEIEAFLLNQAPGIMAAAAAGDDKPPDTPTVVSKKPEVPTVVPKKPEVPTGGLTKTDDIAGELQTVADFVAAIGQGGKGLPAADKPSAYRTVTPTPTDVVESFVASPYGGSELGGSTIPTSSVSDWGVNELDVMAEGGVVQGPTMALLGEEEPEFIVPLSKVDEFKRGRLPLGPPRQARRGGTVANFSDSIPRFANGGLVTGPRFGGVTARGLTTVAEAGPGFAYTTPAVKEELELGEEGRYGGDVTRAPRIASSDFESLLTRYAEPESQRFLSGADMDPGTRAVQLGNIPEYELRQRLGASEFAGTNPARHPIGIQQLMAGRPIARPRSLMTAANMPIPSGQALRNMMPSELEYYQKMGRMAGIPQAELEREMRSAMPGGIRRTPFRMGARRVRQA